MSQDRERLKGWGARRQVGRATPLRDRKKFHAIRAARKAAGTFPAGGWRGTAGRGGAQQRGVIPCSFLSTGRSPLSVAHSQRGGFAADYLCRKQALAASASEQSGASRNLQMTTATLARARCSVFTRSTWRLQQLSPASLQELICATSKAGLSNRICD